MYIHVLKPLFCQDMFVRQILLWSFGLMVSSCLGNTAWIEFVLNLWHCAWIWKALDFADGPGENLFHQPQLHILTISQKAWLICLVFEFHVVHLSCLSACVAALCAVTWLPVWVWVRMPGVTWHNTGGCLHWTCSLWHFWTRSSLLTARVDIVVFCM